MDIEQIGSLVWKTKAVELRDVDAGEKPFLYASGNHGMGYVTIKGLVGYSEIFEPMITGLAEVIKKEGVKVDFVAGLMTGGTIPGYRLSQLISVPFVYLEGTRRKETISGKTIDKKKKIII